MHARRELMIRHAGVPGGDCSSGYSRDAEGQNGGTDEQFHGFISWGLFATSVVLVLAEV
jgi:hypothetical protein